MQIKSFRYASHVPVLRTIIQLLCPASCLELGTGYNSTHLFYKNIQKLISIENNFNWFTNIKNSLPERKGFSIIYHDLGSKIERGTTPENIDKISRRNIRNYYINLKKNISGYDLLFVDQYCSIRSLSLKTLYDSFNIIIFHDSQDKQYDYESFLNIKKEGYLHFRYSLAGVFTDYLMSEKYTQELKIMPDLIRENTGIFCSECERNSDFKGHTFRKI